ncbi:MAG TPA: non-homologous end-joining DNA ligase [Acidimicrobiales bacterium]
MESESNDRAGEERVLEVLDHRITISHPDKIVFPEIGATKLELAEYYLEIADLLAVTAYGRPALLERFPHGAGGSSFFQKRVPNNAPSWLRTTVVQTPNGTTSNALVLDDVAHVLWAVNLGCLGLHLWPFRVADPEHADELRIDLDPQPGTSFDDIRTAADHVRVLLDELGILGYPKTSGGRGLHIYVRLEPRWTSFEVRAAAVALARELERRHPTSLTANWWKEERGERVFIDFNQNAPHKTIYGAWFARPRVGAQVSTPLFWDEIDEVEPDELTIRTVPALVARRGDPWASMPDLPQSLLPLLELAATDKTNGMHDAPWPPEYPKQPDEPPRVAPSRARTK